MHFELTRTEWLIGRKALGHLQESRVAVFGIGGVGSHAVEALARSGVGHLLLVDHDRIDITNVNRQVHALHTTLGQPKVWAMKERIHQIRPAIKVQTCISRYQPAVSREWLAFKPDVVLDAMDTVSAKVDLIQCCDDEKIPLISCMGTGNRREPQRIKVMDLSETAGCPLARVVRKKLRKRGIIHVPVVASHEPPFCLQPPSSGLRSPATISFVPATAGLLMASEGVRFLIDPHRKDNLWYNQNNQLERPGGEDDGPKGDHCQK